MKIFFLRAGLEGGLPAALPAGSASACFGTFCVCRRNFDRGEESI